MQRVYDNETLIIVNVLDHLYLYLISKLQLTPLLDNGVKMTLKVILFF